MKFNQFGEAAKNRDYLLLSRSPLAREATAADIYAKVSAAISLENLEEAKKLLEECRSVLPYPMHELLVTDLFTQNGGHAEKGMLRFLKLLTQFSDPFFHGEVYFLSGLHSLDRGDSKLALQFMLEAENCYQQIGFGAHLWLSRYNQLLAHARIGDFSSYAPLLQELTTSLPSLVGSFKARALWLMASLKIAETESSFARNYLREALRIYRSLDDEQGEAVVCVDLAYLNFLDGLEPTDCGLSKKSPFYAVVEELSFVHQLEGKDLLSRSTRKRILGSQFSSIQWSLLVEAFLLKLQKYSLYDAVLNVALEARRSPRQSLLLPFRDLSYFEAHACFHLGKMERYFFLLQKLEKGDRRMHSFHLLEELRRLPFQTDQISKIIRLDTEKKILQVGERVTALKKNPLLFDFFVVLFSNPSGIKMQSLSEILHGIKFKNGSARMKSLLFRARSVLGHSEAIHYEKGILRLKPELKFHFVEKKAVNKGVEERRRAILLQAQSAKTGLSLKDFQESIASARRTIQQDLHYLVKIKALHASGKNKHRTYSVGQAPAGGAL